MPKHSKKHHRPHKQLASLVIVLASINVIIWSVVAFTELYRDKIMPGVHFAGVAIGGKTVTDATNLVIAKQTAVLNQNVTISVDGLTDTTTPAMLGASVNKDYISTALSERSQPSFLLSYLKVKASSANSSFLFDQTKLETYIIGLKTKVDVAPKDAGLSFTNAALQETPPEPGKTLAVESAKSTITSAYGSHIPTTITLATQTVAPTLSSSEQLQTAKTTLSKLLAAPLTITAENKSITLQPDQIFAILSFGVSNGQLAYDIDQEKATPYIDQLAKKIYIAPISKQLSTTGSVIIEGRDGVQLNKVEAYKTLSQAVIAAETSTIKLASTPIARKTTQDSGDFYDLNRTDGKYVDVSLSKQRIALIENNQLVKIYAMSSGKWSTPTPLGEFSVFNHIATARSALFPELYMDDWMGLQGPGVRNGEYGLHRLPRYKNGSWIEDPAHIGKPLSHGCIRLAPGESTEVYNWAVVGTKVFIHG